MKLAAFCIAAGLAWAQAPADSQARDPYDALKQGDYSSAIAAFRSALAKTPTPALRKDFAYALVKVGEAEEARDQFAEAMKADPSDVGAALEYAYLASDTGMRREARLVFQQLASSGNAQARAVFDAMDRELVDDIARARQALDREPDNFSIHEELGRLLEARSEDAAAAAEYRAAWKLRPERRDLLLAIARVDKTSQVAGLLAAARGPEPRVAESARALLPERYPYVSEFQAAIDLDPLNISLRRELAYLHLAMKNDGAARAELEKILVIDPSDVSAKAQLKQLASPTPQAQPRAEAAKPTATAVVAVAATPSNKEMGERSREKGYLQDAARYLEQAHQEDPTDFDVMMNLGWTYIMMRRNEDAARWFGLATRSPDRDQAHEAERAYKNLKTDTERFRTTIWAAPVFSTRWHDAFAYAQVKTETKLGKVPLRGYLSARFVFDSRGKVDAGLGPQFLSERSVILGAGVATPTTHGVTGWFEAGEMLRYRTTPTDTSRMHPDYRGGVSYSKGFGNLLHSESHGAFYEFTGDGLFASQFQKDWLAYTQHRAGYTFNGRVQVYWNWNATVDLKGQYWANIVETGPSVKLRLGFVPATVRVDFMRGLYLVGGSPYGPNYDEIRIGFWYATTR